MDIQKNAQINLFAELKKSEIRFHQNPEYNGFGIDDLGYFQEQLKTLYDKFEIELNDNLTNRSPSLELYLTDVIKTISEIAEKIRTYRKEEIYETQKDNPEAFKINRLGYMNHFISYQLEVISKTEIELSKKLELVKNAGLFKSVTQSSDSTGASVNLKNKIKFKMKKVDLTVLLWMLAETELFDFEGSHEKFVKFVEDNFQYYDQGKKIYADMKHIGSLMTKLNDPTSAEVNPVQSRKEILALLQKRTLPPEKPVLIKNKWKKV